MGFLAIPYPAIDPVALRLGPLAVKWYGLAYVAGLLLGRFYVKALLQQGRLWPSQKRPFTPERVDDLLLYMTVGVLLGGRLGYVLFYQPRFFLTHPLEIVAVWNGGMSFHGALLGSIVAIVLFARRIGAELWSVMDLAAAATPMGLFFGRLANFINAELWGRPSTRALGDGVPGRRRRGRATRASSTRRSRKASFCLRCCGGSRIAAGACAEPGVIAGTFMIGYGLARSFCEFFREPDVGHWFTVGPFTAGILYSLPMILAGIVIIRSSRRRVAAAPADVRG